MSRAIGIDYIYIKPSKLVIKCEIDCLRRDSIITKDFLIHIHLLYLSKQTIDK